MDSAIIDAYDSTRRLADRPFRSACYAPYTAMVFDSIGRVRACCVNFEHILGDIRTERLDDIWSGQRIRELREALRAYDFSKGCGYCHWKLSSGDLATKSLEAATLITRKYDSLSLESGEPFWPKHLEFHLSNRCNLECRTCLGEYSHLIRKNREHLPPYPMAYGDQFFLDLRKYLPRLEFAQFLGGEPFIIPEMYRVWDMLIADGHAPQCHVSTNGTVFSDRVEWVLEQLPMSLNLSLDSHIPERFEAIRVNAKFARVMRNYRRFREICDRRGTQLRFMITLSRLNWDEFPDYLLFAEDLGVPVSVAMCFNPNELSLFTLPAAELASVIESLDRRAEAVRGRLTMNREVLDQHLAELRHRLGTRSENMFFEGPAPVPEPPWQEPKLVDPWRSTIASAPGWRSLDESGARALLAEWNPDSSIDVLECDPDDIILEVHGDSQGALGFADAWVGHAASDLLVPLREHFGDEVEVVRDQRHDAYHDRIIGFSKPGSRATLVRSLVLPRFDEEGRPIGTVVFIASMPDNRLVVLS